MFAFRVFNLLFPILFISLIVTSGFDFYHHAYSQTSYEKYLELNNVHNVGGVLIPRYLLTHYILFLGTDVFSIPFGYWVVFLTFIVYWIPYNFILKCSLRVMLLYLLLSSFFIIYWTPLSLSVGLFLSSIVLYRKNFIYASILCVAAALSFHVAAYLIAGFAFIIFSCRLALKKEFNVLFSLIRFIFIGFALILPLIFIAGSYEGEKQNAQSILILKNNDEQSTRHESSLRDEAEMQKRPILNLAVFDAVVFLLIHKIKPIIMSLSLGLLFVFSHQVKNNNKLARLSIYLLFSVVLLNVVWLKGKNGMMYNATGLHAVGLSLIDNVSYHNFRFRDQILFFAWLGHKPLKPIETFLLKKEKFYSLTGNNYKCITKKSVASFYEFRIIENGHHIGCDYQNLKQSKLNSFTYNFGGEN